LQQRKRDRANDVDRDDGAALTRRRDLASALNELFAQYDAADIEREVMRLLRERNADIAYWFRKADVEEDIRPGT